MCVYLSSKFAPRSQEQLPQTPPAPQTAILTSLSTPFLRNQSPTLSSTPLLLLVLIFPPAYRSFRLNLDTYVKVDTLYHSKGVRNVASLFDFRRNLRPICANFQARSRRASMNKSASIGRVASVSCTLSVHRVASKSHVFSSLARYDKEHYVTVSILTRLRRVSRMAGWSGYFACIVSHGRLYCPGGATTTRYEHT